MELNDVLKKGVTTWLEGFPADWPVTVDASSPPNWKLRVPFFSDGWAQEAYLPVSASEVPESSVVVAERDTVLGLLWGGRWKELRTPVLASLYLNSSPVPGLANLSLQEVIPIGQLSDQGIANTLTGVVRVPEAAVLYREYVGDLTLWHDAEHGTYFAGAGIPLLLQHYLQVEHFGPCVVEDRTVFRPPVFRNSPRFGDGQKPGHANTSWDILEYGRRLVEGELPMDELLRALDDPGGWRQQGARDERLAPAVLRHLALDPHFEVRSSVAWNPSTPKDVLRQLALDPDYKVRRVLSQRERLPRHLRRRLQRDPVPDVRDSAS